MILHERGHAALGLRNTAGDTQGLGECEEMINRIRRELKLPERQTYVAQVYSAPTFTPMQGSIKLAELVFTRTLEKQGRMQIEKFNLRWEASKVGPVTDTPVQSLAKVRNTKPITAVASEQ